MKRGRTGVIGIALLILAASAWVTLRAQGLGPSSAGSLAELTAEVKQIRLAIQEAGRTQTQMQALNISLTAQHSRLTQVSARLDAVNEELQKASVKTQEAARRLAEFSASIAEATNPYRQALLELLPDVKYENTKATDAENAIRLRQSELMNAFRAEEARWLELVAKLDDVIKR